MAKKKNTKAKAVFWVLMAAIFAAGAYFSVCRRGDYTVVEYTEEVAAVSAAKSSGDATDEATGIAVNLNEADEQPQDSPLSESELENTELPYAAEYFTDFLTDDERLVCKQIYAGLTDFENKINITDGVVKADDICDFIVLCTTCAPEIDYIEPEYSVTHDSEGYVLCIEVTYKKTYEQAQTSAEILEQKANEILSGIDNDWSDYEKYLYLHDYIVKNCEYDETSEGCYTAYGCLVEKKAVCEGYSKALLLLCEGAGLGCLPVTGSGLEDGELLPHIWNNVQIDGEWYCVDLTWDDPITSIGEDYCRYDYFALTDEQMNVDHVRDENKYLSYPAAVSTDANYYLKNGLYIENADEAFAAMRLAVENTMTENGSYVRIKCADLEVFTQSVYNIFELDRTGNGNAEIFEIISECAEMFPEENYDAASYSVIKNELACTVTVKLNRAS